MQPARALDADAAAATPPTARPLEPRPGQVTAAEWRWLAGIGLLLVAILAIPLARLSAAPLALAWNRHR